MSADEQVSASGEAVEKPKWRDRWKGHNHVAFVLAVLSGKRLNWYADKEIHCGSPGSGIQLWGDDDHLLAIEEGRRQLGEQFTQLRHIIRRASVLLPVGLAATVFFLTTLDRAAMIEQPSETIVRIVLLAGAAMTSWGTLVMGALIGAQSSFRKTDALKLTNELPGLRRYLARDYAENVATGENTTAARLTHLGTGVTWIVVGALIGAVGLAVIYWQPADPSPAEPLCCVVECCGTDGGDNGM